jgi:hypothetical protein
MDANPYALACTPIEYVVAHAGGGVKVASVETTLLICFFYNGGHIASEEYGRRFFSCGNVFGEKLCHQGSQLASLSSMTRVEEEMVLTNQGTKCIETKTKTEDTILMCSTFQVRCLGNISEKVGLLLKVMSGCWRVGGWY